MIDFNEQLRKTKINTLSDEEVIKIVKTDGATKIIVDTQIGIIRMLIKLKELRLKNSEIYCEISKCGEVILSFFKENILTFSLQNNVEDGIDAYDISSIMRLDLATLDVIKVRRVFSTVEHFNKITDDFIDKLPSLRPTKIAPNDLKGLKDLLEDVPAFKEIWTKSYNYYQASKDSESEKKASHILKDSVIKTFAGLEKFGDIPT